MTKVYLDIDGVLLTKSNTHAVDGAEEFLDFVLSKYDCYWLTTHCRNGQTDHLLKMLANYFSDKVMNSLEKVKPTVWNTLKTEAIDFNADFYWLDDYVFEAEKDVLKRHGCLNKLILVNLDNKGELLNVMLKLKLCSHR